GTLVTVAYVTAGGNTRDMWYSKTRLMIAPTKIVCLVSEDEGRRWRFLSDVALDQAPVDRRLRGIGFSEPFVEALPDGRLLCMYRDDRSRVEGGRELSPTEHRVMKQCWSSDCGITWTTSIPSGSVGVDPCLLQLKNGVLLCSFGRPRVRLMYSLDGGHTWKGQTTLCESESPVPRLSHAYTSIIPLSDERILYFFDIHEHVMPWSGRLPGAAAGRDNRTNSIFAVPIRVIRKT